MNIREMNNTDFEKLTVLSIQIWLHTYAKRGVNNSISKFVMNHFTPKHFEDIYHSENQKLFVFTDSEHLIGFIAIDLNSICEAGNFGYEVKTLYVQEYFQGKGIGTKLLGHVSDIYGNKYWLTTWVYNSKAIAFYKHLGFTEVGLTYFILEGEKHKNLIFKKS